ncbi:MAG: YggT family protein [Anaerolineales bacterium]|nr:YggT family protein [Anaerolineales bacterium]
MSDKSTKPISVQNNIGIKQRFFLNRSTQITLLAFSILEGLIGLRILLKLIGANPESLLVTLIYGVTSLFLFPFTGLVQSQRMGSMVLETSSMFAVVVYALIAALVEKIITIVFYRPRSPISDVSETTTSEKHPIL